MSTFLLQISNLNFSLNSLCSVLGKREASLYLVLRNKYITILVSFLIPVTTLTLLSLPSFWSLSDNQN